ncbi:hypothetical protein N0V83_004885 [Neocucurbitaria cava]|uniref:Uncharacterized protein n=1 Tax=Neocucurbitaria cava TaxID=798079 RepID=A0A9W8Y8Q7_9PLEO|nr:hypothetical protein N0V83_004885 [Neocucurbitaria cava]
MTPPPTPRTAKKTQEANPRAGRYYRYFQGVASRAKVEQEAESESLIRKRKKLARKKDERRRKTLAKVKQLVSVKTGQTTRPATTVKKRDNKKKFLSKKERLKLLRSKRMRVEDIDTTPPSVSPHQHEDSTNVVTSPEGRPPSDTTTTCSPDIFDSDSGAQCSAYNSNNHIIAPFTPKLGTPPNVWKGKLPAHEDTHPSSTACIPSPHPPLQALPRMNTTTTTTTTYRNLFRIPEIITPQALLNPAPSSSPVLLVETIISFLHAMQNEQSLLVCQSLDLESHLVTLRSTPFKQNVDAIATLERATELVDGLCHDIWVEEYAFRDEIEVLEEELETKEKEKEKRKKREGEGGGESRSEREQQQR